MQRLISLLWMTIFFLIGLFLYVDQTRALFKFSTTNYPVIMGFIKFFILATMGELLGRRLATKRWQIKGINIFQRALVWGLLGSLFTYIFPLYFAGVKGLISMGKIPLNFEGTTQVVLVALTTSTIMNILFGFPMMIFHRLTDTLIDNNKLFSKWPLSETWESINWKNIFGFVLPTIFWFWIPGHTITFVLPPEYRILMASLLGIGLGVILSFAKKK